MDEPNKSLDYLPASISSSLMKYAPIPVLPPKKSTYREINGGVKVKNFPRGHYLEQSFRPYLRASKHVSVIKNLYNKYHLQDFDISVEEQNRFLHESPKNKEFKASRMPEPDGPSRSIGFSPEKHLFKGKPKSNKSRFPPLFENFYQKFNIHLLDLSISSSKLKSP